MFLIYIRICLFSSFSSLGMLGTHESLDQWADGDTVSPYVKTPKFENSIIVLGVPYRSSVDFEALILQMI